MESTPLGYHGIWDAHGCDLSQLEYRPSVERLMDKIVSTLSLTKLSASFKQFEPVGVTGIYLLSESHLSIHTWPERAYAAIDIFSCHPFEEGLMEELLKAELGAKEVKTHSLVRGKSLVEFPIN